MLSIKEKVAKNYEDHPLSKRNIIIEVGLEEEEYTKTEQLAFKNDVSIEEYVFMLLVDKLNENTII